MATVIIVLILVVVMLFAFRGSLGHFKGEGGCCGGGDGTVEEETKVLERPIIGRKIVHVEGMHCENCKNRIERQINRIDGASCKVDLKKNIAVISYDREIKEDQIRNTLRRLDFGVAEIETEE